MTHPVVKEALEKGMRSMVDESTIPMSLHTRILAGFTKHYMKLADHVKGLERGARGDMGLPGRDGKDGKDGRHGRDGKDGRDGIDGLHGRDGKDGIDGKNPEAKEVIEEIKKLQGNDRLHVRHIAGMEALIRHKPGKLPNGGGHGGGGGTTIEVVDLSSQCNGITRTFTIPNTTTFNAPVLLTGTQFPNFYRPSVDFTWSIANKTLTIDASLGAPQSGQTLIFVYAA